MDNNKFFFSEQIKILKEISEVLSNNVSFKKTKNKVNKDEECLKMKHKFLQCVDIENNVEDCSKYFDVFISC